MNPSNSRDNNPKGKDPQDEPQHSHSLTNDLQDDSQDGPQDNDALANDLQGDPQEGSESSNSLAGYAPQQGQNCTSWFEHHLTTSYEFQKSVLSHLNRLDFKHLQLAGIRTPVSLELQKKFLIPSRCDEVLRLPHMTHPVACGNTTQTVREIKACTGIHHDGWGLRGRREQWAEPQRLLKHVRGTDFLVKSSKTNEGAHFDSFNVCIDCHNRDRNRRGPYLNLIIHTFFVPLCQHHSLEQVQQQPYNTCRCKWFLEKYWRCHICTLDTLDELKARAATFGDVPFKTFSFDRNRQVYIDGLDGRPLKQGVCPILNCLSRPWGHGPLGEVMWMCRACTAIMPPVHESAIWPM